MEGTWFANPKEIVNNKKILQFWPTQTQSTAERINSTSRFIIYSTCILYILRRDVKIFMLGILGLAVLYILSSRSLATTSLMTRPVQVQPSTCQLPTTDNPMANNLITDDPERPPACFYPTVKGNIDQLVRKTMPITNFRSRAAMPGVQQEFASRQFMTNPVTTITGDQTGFAEFCYGKKGAPTCREDTSLCSPYARGVQLEARTGFTASGGDHIRGG
jgi:hypothetical protein